MNSVLENSKCYVDFVVDGKVIATFFLKHHERAEMFRKSRHLTKENMRFGVFN